MVSTAIVVTAFAWLAVARWSTETVLALSTPARWIVLAVGLPCGLWAGARYVLTSAGGDSSFDLVELRSRNRVKWRLRGILFAIGSAACSMLAAWYVMHRLVPHVGGVVTVEETTVQGYSRSNVGGNWCHVWIHLDAQLPPDVEVCVESTFFGFRGGARPEIAAIKTGGHILLLRRHNWLGDSVDVDPPTHRAT